MQLVLIQLAKALHHSNYWSLDHLGDVKWL